ncbi:MAG: hypothetical protein BWY63_02624 [Chloroflexi bacterium ADurb.Bin360]|nr:MAG: hypothetical protein BWY63_02624 [Chloroflexi bacterium ADurb.Bin360]
MHPRNRAILVVALVSLLLAGCADHSDQPLDYGAYCWLLTTHSLKLPREPWVYTLNTTCGTYEVPRWVYRSLGLGEPVGIIETEWFTVVVPGVLWRKP